MPERVPFFQRKVTLAILGTLLIGGASMGIALATGPHPGVTAAGSKSAVSQSASATQTSSSSTNTGSQQPQGGAPDATATTAPTNVPPAPQPTSPPAGQTVDVQGIVGTFVDCANMKFKLTNGTVVVFTSSTSWDGGASCSANISPKVSVEIQGQYLTDGYLHASSINPQH